MLSDNLPLVSCIMPTYNRRAFVPHAIRYFLRQEYQNKELIIIDDGTDPIGDLIPDHAAIRYIRLDQKITLGAKLNLACKHALGKIIANWDDDDWYAARRLTYQVQALQNEGTEVCGINHLLYFDLSSKHALQYIYPPDQRTWLAGSSLCYTKALWEKNFFADINVGMDGLFVWATTPNRITVLPDATISVHLIHAHNGSPKKTDGGWWHTYAVEEIQKIMQTDWVIYSNGGFTKVPQKSQAVVTQKAPATEQIKPIKNIYACLVHENEDCIIDLVRNLHYHDPASGIILYNGGENPSLISKHFPLDKFGAVLHPDPIPVKHGYLHPYALSCMQFAVDNFSFDTFTIVDSDQLGIHSGYSTYLAEFLHATSNIGMLSSKPERLTPDNNNVWPAIQAFKEFDLWKPFLHSFPDGESKFLHWTFWPSTVFTSDAIRDLLQLFKENKQLEETMAQSKIWATEEIILPTLVRLLGYDIALNPFSYDFVKYRKSFTLQEVNCALSKTDAYWIHPIERKYEDPLRKYTRQQFNHYTSQKKRETHQKNTPTTMFSTLALLNQIKEIEGWLDDKEADLLIATTLKACLELPSLHVLVEIGSYHGKSTVLLGSVVKAYFPAAKVYAIDPHDGTVGAVDQGLQSLPPSLQKFKTNIENAGLGEVIELIQDYSFHVNWDKPISLLFIDGLHDYPNVARDFWHFSGWIRPGGYIAFHDYADYYPGVMAFVDELLVTNSYQKIQQANSLIIVQKL